MKHFIFLAILILFTFSGCNFLNENEKNLEDSLSAEETESSDDFVIDTEYADVEEADIDEEDAKEEDTEEEDIGEEDIDEEDIDEEEDIEGEPKKDKGFFDWLFGGSDSDDELDESLDDDFVGEEEEFSTADDSLENLENDYSLEESATPSTDTAEQTTTPTEQPTVSEEKTSSSQKTASLNKIMATPYTKAGQIVNTVYIARPNEDLISISQKIYGKDEVNQLLKINTHLQNRPVVVGDKIYYNSPNRPNDTTRLLFYYQDNNISPSYHSLSAGDNIRKIAFQLLGHPKSWKEIWATNPNLESKAEVENNMSIVYWPKSTVVQPVYSAPPEPAPAQPDKLPTQNSMAVMETDNSIPDKESQPEPENQLNAPIPDTTAPALQLNQTKKSKGIVKELLNNIEMIVGIILFLIILFLIIRIIIKKRNQRDFDYTATNIEI